MIQNPDKYSKYRTSVILATKTKMSFRFNKLLILSVREQELPDLRNTNSLN